MTDRDRLAIMEIINLYALAVDSRRWDLFDRIFTNDIDACYASGQHWHELAKFKTEFAAIHESYRCTDHSMTNHLVNVSGLTAEAFSKVSWRLSLRDANGEDTWEGSAWYDDECICKNGTWLIRRRKCHVTWWQRTHRDAVAIAKAESELRPRQVREESEVGSIGYLNAF